MFISRQRASARPVDEREPIRPWPGHCKKWRSGSTPLVVLAAKLKSSQSPTKAEIACWFQRWIQEKKKQKPFAELGRKPPPFTRILLKGKGKGKSKGEGKGKVRGKCNGGRNRDRRRGRNCGPHKDRHRDGDQRCCKAAKKELDATKPYAACANLYIFGLRPDLQFNQFGEVEDVELSPQYQGHEVALVKLSNLHQARWIRENLDGNLPQGLDQENCIHVRFAAYALQWNSAFGRLLRAIIVALGGYKAIHESHNCVHVPAKSKKRRLHSLKPSAITMCAGFSIETSDPSDTESLTDLVANTSGKAGQSGGGEVGRTGRTWRTGREGG